MAQQNYFAGEAVFGLMPAGYAPSQLTASAQRCGSVLWGTGLSADKARNYSVLVHEIEDESILAPFRSGFC